MHKACNFIKKDTLAQVFSCEFWEISKNTFSYRASPLAASEPIIGAPKSGTITTGTPKTGTPKTGTL